MIIDGRIRPPYKSFWSALTAGEGEEDQPARQYPFFTGYDMLEELPSLLHNSMDLFIKEMDEAGIDKAVLVGRQAGRMHILNEDIAELRDKYPDRFPAALAGIDVNQDILKGMKEIEYCVKELGFNGIDMDPGWCFPPVYPDDKRVYPFYAKCAELGCVLYISFCLIQGPDISYVQPWRIQRVANDFPTLKIMVAHTAAPFTNEMIGVMLHNSRLGNIWALGDFWINQPGYPGREDWVHAANNFIGSRIVFGSCYPVRPLKLGLEQFKALPFKPEILDDMLAKNASEFFEIDF